MSDLPWLTITVFVPVAGALVLGLLTAATHGSEEARRSIWRWGALAVSVVAFVASLAILFGFETGRAGVQMAERASWAGPLNLRYALGVDGVSLGMVLLTTLLMPLSILASWRVTDRVPAFMASMLVLETAMLGTFLATDLLLFFVFFEGMLFPMYLIIGAWGGARRVYAAVKFFIYTMAGSALLLAAILFLYFRAGADLGAPTFELTELAKLDLPLSTARWLFLAFFLAFAVKVPLFPLHTWLPDAHVEAPTAG
ncbi:MAG TPA: NADH-quinone oxidoreductase subunit M, partial [Actinomycetota bacterium]|nr:NADH-quinone oxidoreductase subunit M [Actinomycetota bacterium]